MNEKANPTRRAVLQGFLAVSTLAAATYVTAEPAAAAARQAEVENQESEGRHRVPVGLL